MGGENCLAGPFIAEIQKETRNSKQRQSNIGRAYRLLILVLILRPFGNLSLAWGMRHVSNILSTGALGYIRPVLNPFVVLGIALLILATLTRMALLSLADLSLVLPLTATGYILSALLGKFLLSEQVTLERWAGVLLIFVGTVVVGSTSGNAVASVMSMDRSENAKRGDNR